MCWVAFVASPHSGTSGWFNTIWWSASSRPAVEQLRVHSEVLQWRPFLLTTQTAPRGNTTASTRARPTGTFYSGRVSIGICRSAPAAVLRLQASAADAFALAGSTSPAQLLQARMPEGCLCEACSQRNWHVQVCGVVSEAGRHAGGCSQH